MEKMPSKKIIIISVVAVIILILIAIFAYNNAQNTKAINARDTERMTNLEAMKTKIEEHYETNFKYPTIEEAKSIFEWIKDPLFWTIENNCNYWYYYEYGYDNFWQERQKYKLSVCYENKKNTQEKTLNSIDWWTDDFRQEVWNFWKEYVEGVFLDN